MVMADSESGIHFFTISPANSESGIRSLLDLRVEILSLCVLRVLCGEKIFWLTDY